MHFIPSPLKNLLPNVQSEEGVYRFLNNVKKNCRNGITRHPLHPMLLLLFITSINRKASRPIWKFMPTNLATEFPFNMDKPLYNRTSALKIPNTGYPSFLLFHILWDCRKCSGKFHLSVHQLSDCVWEMFLFHRNEKCVEKEVEMSKNLIEQKHKSSL